MCASDPAWTWHRYIWKAILYPSAAQEGHAREQRLRAMKHFYDQHCDSQSAWPRLINPQLLYDEAARALGMPVK